MRFIGVDIGGTKCAVTAGRGTEIEQKVRFDTTCKEETLDSIIAAAEQMGHADAIGISCGGPLDSKRGIIMSPPNLPGWDNVEIVRLLRERFDTPAFLKNDADACALAEWRYGAGRGAQNMIFLTFGTGMGAGLILNGRLYSGAGDMAGEVGHIRLRDTGPVGYGKAGSFEGFCSGGGIGRMAREYARSRLAAGKPLPYCDSIDSINAQTVAEAALGGNPHAGEIYRKCGEMLGRGVSILIDILNPELIVIGSVFQRSEALLRDEMERVIQRECLSYSRSACRIVAAQLKDSLGDIAALTIAECGAKGEL